ncbi:hypothetical protein [Pectobacterium phage Peat1]|uniref:Uncharacterized protein n=1 Tax=Pectobacterium phage Peat1 TaxID=1654601 RepID=A0A0H3YEP9_9CAUD|nr:terminase small subunit [Pectobacterium phage Peat1]AKN21206.1 hypothetical protein [Pectobacterium phage Peat1]
MAASQSKLAELHEMLAEVMLDDLKQSKEEGIPLPAANLGVIRQFLKDNDISASMDADDMAKTSTTKHHHHCVPCSTGDLYRYSYR